MAAIAHGYRYEHASQIRKGHLVLATSGGEAAHPYFFEGALRAPQKTASAMLTLSRIARSRFHLPPAMLARILREADPVVTASRDRLRMESFSACCGVYARLDLLPGAIDGTFQSAGTTNVDFNPEMRAELARVGASDRLGLSVGRDEVRVKRAAAPEVVERKVPLPLRWFQGFLAVGLASAQMECVHDVGGSEARRFLRSVPTDSPKEALWVVAAGKGLRISARPSKRGLPVGGIARLRVLDDLIRHAKGMRVYRSDSGYSAWELHLGESRFTLVLSAECWRGFSGDGLGLRDVASSRWDAKVPHMRAALNWNSRIAADAIAESAGLSEEEAGVALTVLASRGLVGYDLADACYFHRELPFALEEAQSAFPRLVAARHLLDSGGVLKLDAKGSKASAKIRGSGVTHTVTVDGDGATCTCPWHSKHRGERGPCKHILAVRLAMEDE